MPLATIEVGLSESETELGAPGVLILGIVFEVAPVADAVIDQEPATVLAVVVGIRACPAEPMVTGVVRTPPAKVPLGPEAGVVSVTTWPGIVLLYASRALMAWPLLEKFVPTVADTAPPPGMPRWSTAPGVIV